MNGFLNVVPNEQNVIVYMSVFIILSYVFFSLSLLKTANSKHLKNSWLCFIPIANMWFLGKVIESFAIGRKRFQDAELRLLTSSIVFILVMKIPIVGFLVGFAHFVLVTFCFLEFIKRTSFDNQ